MAKQAKDRFGYLGTEPGVLREQLDRLSIALEDMVNAESKEAMRRADDAARHILSAVRTMLDGLGSASSDAASLAEKGREEVEQAIRAQPWLAVALAAAGGFVAALLLVRR